MKEIMFNDRYGLTQAVLDKKDYKVGDIVPYINTRGNVRMTKITSFVLYPNGKTWFYGIDTKTNAKTWYPVHISKTLANGNNNQNDK